MTTKILDGKAVHCQACDWVGLECETLSMAGFEFCPSCKHRHTGFMPEAYDDALADWLAQQSKP